MATDALARLRAQGWHLSPGWIEKQDFSDRKRLGAAVLAADLHECGRCSR